MPSEPGPNYPMPEIDAGPAVPMPGINTGPAVPMPAFPAEVQPLQAGATAGYLEAFRAAMGQTASTSSPENPITAEEHHPRVVPTYARAVAGRCAKCAVPFSHRGRHEDGPYCDYCVTQCRQAGRTALHLCVICR